MTICDLCDKELTSQDDIQAGVCLECDEYRCSDCGEEYDVEYGICACGERIRDEEGNIGYWAEKIAKEAERRERYWDNADYFYERDLEEGK